MNTNQSPLEVVKQIKVIVNWGVPNPLPQHLQILGLTVEQLGNMLVRKNLVIESDS